MTVYYLTDTLADRDQLNAMLWHVYGEWTITGERQEAYGRNTWPAKWDDVSQWFLSAEADDHMDSLGEKKGEYRAL